MTKQFSPHIYPEWGELISDLPIEKQAEIFNAILKYPNIDIDSGIWRFIKSQIDRDYEEFLKRCEKNGIISRNYWKSKRKQAISNESERISNDNRTISNDILNINENINGNGNENINENKNENKKENNKKKKAISENWRPKAETINKLKSKNLVVEVVIDKFINACLANNYRYVDFDRAILAWDWDKDKSVQKKLNCNEEGVPY